MFDRVKNFFKDHKEEIFVAGKVTLIATTTVLSIVAVRNAGFVDSALIESKTYNCGKFSVSAHLRNLPIGYVHSASNEAKAISAGVNNLQSNQSFIASFMKNIKG